jgi:hypothetical protein
MRSPENRYKRKGLASNLGPLALGRIAGFLSGVTPNRGTGNRRTNLSIEEQKAALVPGGVLPSSTTRRNRKSKSRKSKSRKSKSRK